MTDTLHIRSATRDDEKVLFDMRNDEDTRRVSGTTAPLEWGEHVKWLEKVLSGGFSGRALYIVETNAGELIGTVRSDLRDDGYTEISYTVAPAARGKGLGKRMVLQFAREHLADKKLAARIKRGGNPASESIARALGLKPFSEAPSEDREDPRPMVEWR